MRCRACDVLLTNFEATRKIKGTSDYLDLCNKCYYPVSKDFKVDERLDLASGGVFDDYDSLDTSD